MVISVYSFLSIEASYLSYSFSALDSFSEVCSCNSSSASPVASALFLFIPAVAPYLATNSYETFLQLMSWSNNKLTMTSDLPFGVGKTLCLTTSLMGGLIHLCWYLHWNVTQSIINYYYYCNSLWWTLIPERRRCSYSRCTNFFLIHLPHFEFGHLCLSDSTKNGCNGLTNSQKVQRKIQVWVGWLDGLNSKVELNIF